MGSEARCPPQSNPTAAMSPPAEPDAASVTACAAAASAAGTDPEIATPPADASHPEPQRAEREPVSLNVVISRAARHSHRNSRACRSPAFGALQHDLGSCWRGDRERNQPERIGAFVSHPCGVISQESSLLITHERRGRTTESSV